MKLLARAVLLCITALWIGSLSPAQAAEKIKITKLDDLPRYTYKISVTAAQFIDDSAAIKTLSDAVKKDLEADLEKYDIADKTAIKDYYQGLGTIALLDGQHDVYLSCLAKRRELEDKEASRLTMGLVAQAYVTAKKSSNSDFSGTFKAALQKLLDGLPYEKVQDILKQSKGSFEIMSKNLTVGSLEAHVQPILDKSGGEISKDIALGLIGAAFSTRIILPIKDDAVQVYTAYLNAHAEQKADIWAARDVALTQSDNYSPVLLAIWDSGVDANVFKSQMWTNPKEIPNDSIDNDHNGFVDDVHGIAYSLDNDKEISLLFPLGDATRDHAKLLRQIKGLEDLQANLDSPESRELKQMMATLPKDSVKPTFEAIGMFGNYCHGTHVAGIAVKDNPFARVLAARITYDYHYIPELPTEELAHKEAKAAQETVDYFKQQGVRVANMSWGGSLRSVEEALEANNAGGTPEERKALARKIYEISRVGLFNALKSAPDILFVISAGNSDANVNFEEYYPSSFDLPNVLTVGAVDQAGDETSFTSFGKVDCYANGYEVLSYVPGGEQIKFSGTSMSAPNVVNLVGKLLAKKPTLTVAQLRELVLKACDEKQAGERKVMLVNPKKSLELLAAMK